MPTCVCPQSVYKYVHTSQAPKGGHCLTQLAKHLCETFVRACVENLFFLTNLTNETLLRLRQSLEMSLPNHLLDMQISCMCLSELDHIIIPGLSVG